MRRRVTWKTFNPAGETWWAYCGGNVSGYVKKLRSGSFEANAKGRRNRVYAGSMEEGARFVVGYLTHTGPSRLSR